MMLPGSAKEKIEQAGMININVGSGTDTKPGYINYDFQDSCPEIDIVADIRDIHKYFEESSVDNIILFQVLEHFKREEWRDILTMLCQLIKVDGFFHVRVPYVPDLTDEFMRGNIDEEFFFRAVFGGQRVYEDNPDPYSDYHKSGSSIEAIKDFFVQRGFFVEEINHLFRGGIIHITAKKGGK